MRVLIAAATAFALGLFCSATLTIGAESTTQTGPTLEPVLLQMIRDDAVHEDLEMTSGQVSTLTEFLPEVDSEWFRARNYPVQKRLATIDQLTSKLRSSLQGILEPNQIKRLDQLECQALGTRMVLHQQIGDKFGVTEEQRAVFIETAGQTDEAVAAVHQQVEDGKIDAKAGSWKVAELQKGERVQFVKTLTPQQSKLLPLITGKTFNFGKITRTYPMAPELESEGVTWLQGNSLQLSDLRGKVVAVHFYAFQCINCQRNLPHYKAWHSDYADQGLVVVGIQTPETSSERSAERVKAAAIQEGIEYPVLLDLKKSNWDAWHNTMWPTVYLIDKKGFLRRWYQGELNWKGKLMEKDMRKTIEALLIEH